MPTDPQVPETQELNATVMALMSNLAEPQRGYMEIIDGGGFAEVLPGFAMSFGRDDTHFVACRQDAFSVGVDLGLGNVRPLIPLNIDGAEHRRYRRILDPLFSGRRMDALVPAVRARANELIDAFVDRGECDFTEEYAEIFPSSVLLSLLGLPQSELRTCLDLRDGVLHPERSRPEALTDLELRSRMIDETGRRIYDYFGAAVDERMRRPTDDVLGHLVTAEVDGCRLTRDEVLDVCYLFVLAGLDTVSDTLTCTFAFLARNGGYRRQLLGDPSVIPSAVEELLRWETPVPATVPRVAICPVTLPSGARVAEGMRVMPHWGGANLDPETFGDPMTVRFDRDSNRHFAFGAGGHRCLGAHLARRELRITLEEWHRRIPSYGIKTGHEDLRYANGLRHVLDLMLAWP